MATKIDLDQALSVREGLKIITHSDPTVIELRYAEFANKVRTNGGKIHGSHDHHIWEHNGPEDSGEAFSVWIYYNVPRTVTADDLQFDHIKQKKEKEAKNQ